MINAYEKTTQRDNFILEPFAWQIWISAQSSSESLVTDSAKKQKDMSIEIVFVKVLVTIKFIKSLLSNFAEHFH